MRPRPRTITVGVVVAVLAGGCGASPQTGVTSPSKLAPTTGRYAPAISAADFGTPIDNRYFPLRPGTHFHFQGTKGSTPQTDDEVVTHRTRLILGIAATAVRDVVSERGRPVERTLDFYAQDKHGNVWYLGEDSFELRHGRFVKASDSWRSGVDGAKPGIIMPADPRRGESYRQEYYPPGEALDEAHVLGYRGPVSVPYGRFKRELVTSEYSPLEPQTEQKEYVAGVGEIRERIVKGGHEEFRLVSVTHRK